MGGLRWCSAIHPAASRRASAGPRLQRRDLDAVMALVGSEGPGASLWRSDGNAGAPTALVDDPEDGLVSDAAFGPDAKRLVVRTESGRGTLWDVQSGAKIAPLGPVGPAREVAWTRDGTTIAAAVGSSAGIWDAVSGAKLADLPGQEGEVLSAVISPNGSRIATVSNSHWDPPARDSTALGPD